MDWFGNDKVFVQFFLFAHILYKINEWSSVGKWFKMMCLGIFKPSHGWMFVFWKNVRQNSNFANVEHPDVFPWIPNKMFCVKMWWGFFLNWDAIVWFQSFTDRCPKSLEICVLSSTRNGDTNIVLRSQWVADHVFLSLLWSPETCEANR